MGAVIRRRDPAVTPLDACWSRPPFAYLDENRAIAAFNGPGLAAGTWEGPTSHADLWPSIFAAMGWEAPESFRGTVIGERPADTARYALRHQRSGPIHAVEREGIKLIYHWDSGEKALYRLESDPSEQDDVYDPEAPDVVALWALMSADIKQMLAINPEPAPVDPGP
jgi:hypothetical protein